METHLKRDGFLAKAGLALLAFVGAALCLSAPANAANEWPGGKPIRIVLGAPPGGAADILTRLLAERLSRTLHQSVIVDYKPGASGAIGAHDLIASPADGYTFMLIQRGIVTEVPQAMKVSYDPFKDLKPIAQVSRQGLLLVGNPNLPAKKLAELIAYVKANPKKLSCASPGIGVRLHTAGVQFGQLAGLDMTFVGYKGSPPALQDVMGGHVELMVDGPSTSIPFIKSGKIRAFATTYPVRMAALPNVPTFKELGFPALSEVSWFALWARPAVPQDIQDKVRNATLQFLNASDVKAKLAELGLEPGLPLTSEELTKDMHEAYERHGKVLRSINFQPE